MATPVLHLGDCLDVLRTLPDASVHAVVTDPPYGLAEHKPATVTAAVTAWTTGDRDHVPDGKGFMGRAWDGFVPPPAVWDECLRVLKPGGHLLCFAGTRTVDLMGLSIRLAGFEIRDAITWHYGSGFPKGIDVSKAIDKAAGAERVAVGSMQSVPNHNLPGTGARFRNSDELDGARIEVPTATVPATEAAQKFDGWNTALKPASEPIIVARKPLSGTVTATVLEHGTGALNIDACRVGTGDKLVRPSVLRDDNEVFGKGLGAGVQDEPAGRWPTNTIFVHGPDCGEQCQDGCPVAELDAQSGNVRSAGNYPTTYSNSTGFGGAIGKVQGPLYSDTGGASRFFPTFRYQAKAPTRERPKVDGVAHPTCKPLELMRWLVRLVTPPGGTILEPFAGSGTTIEAALLEGFDVIGIERQPEYIPLIEHRIKRAQATTPTNTPNPQPGLFDVA